MPARAVLLCLLMSLLGTVLSAGEERRRPNILFILADDQSPMDLAVYNPATGMRTPVIGQLAAQGLVIDVACHLGAFMGGVCVPSRTMIMTGRTLWRLPFGPGSGTCPADIADQTLPAVFGRAGYATMRTCKDNNCYPAANQRFQVLREATRRGSAENGSSWHAQQVLDYLDERARTQDRRPFLIQLGFSHPHDPRDASLAAQARHGAAPHTDRATPPTLRAGMPPLPATWLPAHPFPTGHDAVRDEIGVDGVWSRRDAATVRNELGRNLACGEEIDEQIGRVLAHLRASGELDNTVVIYTADHGMAVGRHGLLGKQNLYEHSWRVPLIISGPGVPSGVRARGNVYLGDLLATLCDLADIPVPTTNEGISFATVIRGKTDRIREVMHGVYCGGEKPGIRCVRQGDWKLIAYGSTRRVQLFNLADNPQELLVEHHATGITSLTGVTPLPQQRDLADDPAYATVRHDLEVLLLAEMRRLGDPYRLWFQPDDGVVAPSNDQLRKPKDWR